MGWRNGPGEPEDDDKSEKVADNFDCCHKFDLRVRKLTFLAERWTSMLRFDSTCASSLYTSTYAQIMVEFHCSRIVATLGLSLFVIGLGLGPMVLGPLSEVTLLNFSKVEALLTHLCQFYGRRIT